MAWSLSFPVFGEKGAGIKMEKEKVYIIKVDKNREVQVTKEVYQCYYREIWREEKNEKVWRTRCYSFDEVMENGYDIRGRLLNIEKPVEEAVERNIEGEFVRSILNRLSYEEKELLISLILKEEGERDYGKRKGISKTAVNYRRKKLLQSLREKLSKYF